ncbi:hypothetical protein ACUTAF_18935 [Pseudomonas sp. SP16.1]|uniref:hypothetical protein n=1 Tax=Pseudomonas sp. SP16.1 TaxID=3458854 RepID=UPI0040465146
MARFAVLSLLAFVLVGCAGGAREEACELLSPAPIEQPTTQDDRHIERQSSGDPTGAAPVQGC